MAIEKEMKLALGGTTPQALTQWLQQRASAVAPGARAGDKRVGSSGRASTFALRNIYYDTPALDLARGKIALRLRLSPHGWLQTLKTAGKSVSGLHARGEWEMPVAGPSLDLEALRTACDDPAALTTLQAFHDAGIALIPVFRTDFDRTVWPIRHHHADIEVALDLGKVFVPDERNDAPHADSASLAIEELELELQGGDGSDEERETALVDFANTLRATFPDLRADDTSKAARGYALFKARQALPVSSSGNATPGSAQGGAV